MASNVVMAVFWGRVPCSLVIQAGILRVHASPCFGEWNASLLVETVGSLSISVFLQAVRPYASQRNCVDFVVIVLLIFGFVL
jgi:hypothetical protein